MKLARTVSRGASGRGEASAGAPTPASAYQSGAPADEGAEGTAVVRPERVVLILLPLPLRNTHLTHHALGLR